MTCHKYTTGKIGCSQIEQSQCLLQYVANQTHDVKLFHRDPFNWFENAELKRLNYINTSWSHLCTKHSSHTGKSSRGRRGVSGLGCVSVVVCSGRSGKSKCSSGRRVKQLLDHLLHFLWPVLVVLLRVLSERDVCASTGRKKVWRSKRWIHCNARTLKPKEGCSGQRGSRMNILALLTGYDSQFIHSLSALSSMQPGLLLMLRIAFIPKMFIFLQTNWHESFCKITSFSGPGWMTSLWWRDQLCTVYTQCTQNDHSSRKMPFSGFSCHIQNANEQERLFFLTVLIVTIFTQTAVLLCETKRALWMSLTSAGSSCRRQKPLSSATGGWSPAALCLGWPSPSGSYTAPPGRRWNPGTDKPVGQRPVPPAQPAGRRNSPWTCPWSPAALYPSAAGRRNWGSMQQWQ